MKRTIIVTFFYLTIILVILIFTLNVIDTNKSEFIVITPTPYPSLPANCHWYEDGGPTKEACDR